jgi:superfamily II DNA or RNA helicase
LAKKTKKKRGIPPSLPKEELAEIREEAQRREIRDLFTQINDLSRRGWIPPWEATHLPYIQELNNEGYLAETIAESRAFVVRCERQLRESTVIRPRVSPPKDKKPTAKPTSKAGSAKKQSPKVDETKEVEPQPIAPPGPAIPLPEAVAEATPVTFVAEPDDGLLRRLLEGPVDDITSVILARRGIEMLAEERFDRLLALKLVRGVDHYTYQIETVLRVLKRFRGRVLLADEVGLGKTIEGCLVLKEYILRVQVRRALILVPPALVGQWAAELEDKFGIEAVTTHDPLCRNDPQAFWATGQVIVASLAAARGATHRDMVLAQRFDMVMVDEAHHIKNRNTKGWELVNGLRSRFFLMLTATPVETNLSELYNLVTLLRPGTLGTDAEFRKRFVSSDDPAAPKDPEKLRELLREVMIRNTRAVSGVMLPPRTARTIIVRPRAEESELYELILHETRRLGLEHRALFRLLMEEAGSSPAAVASTAAASKARRKDPALDRALGEIERVALSVATTEKIERLAELIPGDKALVFSRFRATMDQIAADLAGRGLAFAPFHGGMNSLEKDAAVAAFASDGVDVLLCSEIGGEGRNLQFCHRLINFDLPWNPMKIEQRIGRIHRIGQTETVEVINLACAGTAEEHILEVLDRRVNLFELVVGEMDLLLGELTDERDFEDQVFDIYAGSDADAQVEAGFEELAQKLLKARNKLEKTRALDEALFGEGYEA